MNLSRSMRLDRRENLFCIKQIAQLYTLSIGRLEVTGNDDKPMISAAIELLAADVNFVKFAALYDCDSFVRAEAESGRTPRSTSVSL